MNIVNTRNRRLIRSTQAVLAAVACVLLLLPLMLLLRFSRPAEADPATSARKKMYAQAEVTAVLSEDLTPDIQYGEERRTGTQEVEVRLLSGPHKNEILQLTNFLGVLNNVDVSAGDRVIVRLISNEDGSYYAVMFNYDRSTVLGGVLLVFCAVLLLLGGKKGAKALLGLLYTLICIWFFLIPCMIQGVPVIPVTVYTVAATAVASLLLLDGFSRKTLCAALGCVGGVSAAAITAWAAGRLTPLDGFNMTEAENLLLYGSEHGLRIGGLLVCGVLISALGAVMDVAMSIASAEWELITVHPELTAGELFRSGMHIGRDAMGTMANTLILAFAGSSFNMLLLIQVYDIPFLQLINTDFLCIELLQGMAGSLGILLTVPLVAAAGACVMARRPTGV